MRRFSQLAVTTILTASFRGEDNFFTLGGKLAASSQPERNPMQLVWYVALGSGIGGAARFALSTVVQQRAASAFPFGTLIVNVTGALVLGFILRFALGSPGTTPELRALIGTGFCGGYTTFSAFSYETLTLMQAGDYRRAAIYVVTSVVLAIAATFVGMTVANTLFAARH